MLKGISTLPWKTLHSCLGSSYNVCWGGKFLCFLRWRAQCQEPSTDRSRTPSHKAEPPTRGPNRFIGSLEKMTRCHQEGVGLGIIALHFNFFSREIQDDTPKLCSFGNKVGCASVWYTDDDKPVFPVSLMKADMLCTRETYPLCFDCKQFVSEDLKLLY